MLVCIQVAHGHPEACETCACRVVRPAVYDGPTCVDCGGRVSDKRCLRCQRCANKERGDRQREARLRPLRVRYPVEEVAVS